MRFVEDDNLVTKISVQTEQMLEPAADASLVDLLIAVQTCTTRVTIGNPDFG
jgi:hypothetical protein